MLTRPGASFASRVAASLLHAIGMSELIAATPEEDEALAIALASDRPRLAELKRRLGAALPDAALFDTRRFTAHLEDAFAAMHARHRAGLPPDDIAVARRS